MLPNNHAHYRSGQAAGGYLSKITASSRGLRLLVLAGILSLPIVSHASVLTSGTFTTGSGAGGSGAGTSTTCMIISDGTSWSGGAVGVQGSSAPSNIGTPAGAANVSFKFNIGTFVDSLNTTYGAGNWTVSNIQLKFQYTLYANNSRFGAGAGDFDIYWVANDSWTQGTANPAYATSASALSSWSSGQALLGSEYYDWTTPSYQGSTADLKTAVWTTDKTGTRQSILAYNLAASPDFLTDILTATGSGDANISLYLMSTSDSLGLTIFTGGGSSLPTLTFDVVSVPEPGGVTLVLLGAGSGFLLWLRRRNCAERSNHPVQ